jgi:hypothetical protein
MTPFLIFIVLVGAGAAIFYFYKKSEDAEKRASAAGAGKAHSRSSKGGSDPQPERKRERERETLSGLKLDFSNAAEVPTNIVPGFRDLRWGQPPIEGMTKVHQGNEDALYSRENDVLRVGPAVANSILYGFFRDRFQAVMLDFPLGSFESLAKHIASEWGAPRVSKDGFKVVWQGLLAGDEATNAVLEKRVETKTSKLLITSASIQAEREKERQQTKV